MVWAAAVVLHTEYILSLMHGNNHYLKQYILIMAGSLSLTPTLFVWTLQTNSKSCVISRLMFGRPLLLTQVQAPAVDARFKSCICQPVAFRCVKACFKEVSMFGPVCFQKCEVSRESLVSIWVLRVLASVPTSAKYCMYPIVGK